MDSLTTNSSVLISVYSTVCPVLDASWYFYHIRTFAIAALIIVLCEPRQGCCGMTTRTTFVLAALSLKVVKNYSDYASCRESRGVTEIWSYISICASMGWLYS